MIKILDYEKKEYIEAKKGMTLWHFRYGPVKVIEVIEESGASGKTPCLLVDALEPDKIVLSASSERNEYDTVFPKKIAPKYLYNSNTVFGHAVLPYPDAIVTHCSYGVWEIMDDPDHLINYKMMWLLFAKELVKTQNLHGINYRRSKVLREKGFYIEIQEILKKYDIKELLHFTKTENIGSIRKHGIVPRDYLPEWKIQAKINDEKRLDGHPDYSSFSVKEINKRLLSAYIHRSKEKNKEEKISYSLIKVDSKVLLSPYYRFFFSSTNAANHEVLNKSLKTFTSVAALKRCIDGGDDQAEIMIQGVIPPEYILSIEDYPLKK